jgi:membrane peptidoglycan carboxypeptidase
MATKKPSKRAVKRNTGRKSKNTFTTKSGKTIKLNRNIVEKFKARKVTSAKRKSERLIGMPKGRVKRALWYIHPRQMRKYWFSREGAIMALKVTGIGILVVFLIIVGVFAFFRKDLPNINDVSGNNIGGSDRYYDNTGEVLLWEDFDAIKRIPVKGEEMSQYVKDATVAIEDKDFYSHGGFDVKGITRAGISNVFGGSGGTQGGSTITQQLVKLTQSWTDTQTYSRKVKELILAVQLEQEYSKEEILAGYLNTAPYGNIEYGVQAAANNYFHKDAKDLTIAESAFLAAIPKAPSLYSPYGPYFDKPAVVGRSIYIIDLMREQGMITEEEADKAKEIDVVATVKKQEPKYSSIKAPYFVLAAKDELNNRYTGVTNRGGWKIITTVDMKLQKYAEDAIRDNVPTINRYGANTSAFVAVDVETGQIVAQVGGVDFENKEYGKINYAHNAFIPPGSTFKPYDYAALIEYTDTAGGGSVLYDQRGPLPGYACTDKGLPPPRGTGNCLQNYDFRYPGATTLRYSLGGSRNVPAIKANLIVGTDKVIDMASAMMANPNNPNAYQCYEQGDETYTQTTPCYAASAIGDGAFLHLDDHVNGLATLARLGEAIPRTYLLKIIDASDKTMYEYERPRGEQVIRPDTAYIVNDMSADPNASYLPYSYKFHNYNGWRFAIKTGTTNNGFDGLMASWSAKYATISWVGHHTRNQELTGAMEYMTTPITRTWMEKAHKDLEPKNWEKPSGVQTLPAYIVRQHIGIGSVEPSSGTDLYPSWYKKPGATNTEQRIDIVSNKKATECTPADAIKVTSGVGSNVFSIDTFVDKAAVSDAEDDIHKCDDVKPQVNIESSNITCDGSCTISAKIFRGTHPLSSEAYKGRVTFSIDGKTINSQAVSKEGNISFSYSPTFNGSKTITAQIVDSVLYQGSDSSKIFASIASNPTLSLSAQTAGLTSATFNWTGNWSGKVTVYFADDDAEICTGNNDNTTTCDADNPGVYSGKTVYAKDEDGTKSDDVTISN